MSYPLVHVSGFIMWLSLHSLSTHSLHEENFSRKFLEHSFITKKDSAKGIHEGGILHCAIALQLRHNLPHQSLSPWQCTLHKQIMWKKSIEKDSMRAPSLWKCPSIAWVPPSFPELPSIAHEKIPQKESTREDSMKPLHEGIAWDHSLKAIHEGITQSHCTKENYKGNPWRDCMKQFMERKSMKHEAHKRARNTMTVSRLHCKYLPSDIKSWILSLGPPWSIHASTSLVKS